MKRQSALFLALLLFATLASAQLNRSNFWPVAQNFGVDFTSGSPVSTGTGMLVTESAASISDTSGNLLFYTNGEEIRNANMAVMPNGSGILGCQSSTQGAVIVPMPQNPNIYYVFTTSCFEQNFTLGARYSIIDMSLDNGLGDVTVKNQSIRTNVAEELAATYHNNNCDFWVVFHDLSSSNYYSYLLTDTGLDTVPVTSSAGPNYAMIGSSTYGRTMLKFNQGGTMAVQTARQNTTPQVHQFDRSNGQFSAFIDIAPWSFLNDYYSGCFSPNDSVLYIIARAYGSSTTSSYLIQYDLSTPTSSAVSASRDVLHVQGTGPNLGQMQLGPDGLIYFSLYQQPFLGTITNPNVVGAGAIVDHVAFNTGSAVQYALPNFVSQFIGPGPNLGCTPPVAIELSDYDIHPKVYPNPSQGRVHFEFNQLNGEHYHLKINDLLGRVVFEQKEVQSPFQFNGDDLPAGVYVYTLFEGDQLISQGKLRME